MLLAALLLMACNGDDVVAPTDGDDDIVRTGTRPVVEAVDSALDTGGTIGDTQPGPTAETGTTPDPELDCENEEDDDGDGLTDCEDPDCDFTPNCASEICGDGIDNEGDGLIDCLDSDCDTDAACDTSCADAVLTGPTPIQYSGNTSGGVDNTSPTCATSSAEDRAFAFIADAGGNYVFDTAGSSYDTTMYLYNGCSGNEVACNDDSGGTLQSRVTGPVMAGQVVIVVVDGYSSNTGDFRLNITN